MLVFKQGSPEMQLLDLFELAEKIGHAQQYTAGPGAAALEEATRVARESIAERIRAVSAEVAKASVLPPEPTFAPADVSTLKVGDEIWVRAEILKTDTKDAGRPIQIFVDDTACWPSADRLFVNRSV